MSGFDNYKDAEDPSIVKTPTGYQVNAPVVSVTTKREVPQAIPYSGSAEAARALLEQGLGMGFGEEIEAGLRAPFSEEDYKTIRDLSLIHI